MINGLESRALILLAGAASCWAGCESAIEVDIDCRNLCLAAPGPTLPGLSSLLPPVFVPSADGSYSLDAGQSLAALPTLDASAIPSSIDWTASFEFNEVIAQLPSSAVSVSLDVRLNSITLSSTTDLSFITGVQVFLSRAQSSPPDGGHSGYAECFDRLSTNPVATFDSQMGSNGASIALVNLVPEVNLFDCLKAAPAKLLVVMAIQPSTYPTVDVPLTLSTCVGAQSTATYP